MFTDLLTRIRNAQAVDKAVVRLPYSKMDKSVADILQDQGFLKKVEVKGRVPRKVLKLYMNPKRPVRGVKFLSRPSLKRYSGFRDFKSVKSGHGILVVSTPKGVVTGKDARRDHVGGQLLFEIW